MKNGYQWEVDHPDFHPVKVTAPDMPGAVLAACRAWGVQEDWVRLAGDCSARKLGRAAKPRCRRCGREFGQAGEEIWICPDCQKKEAQYQREKRNAFRYRKPERKRERVGRWNA